MILAEAVDNHIWLGFIPRQNDCMDRIDQLRAFVRVVERGSFTAVARELRVKQSTVSKWLQATEDELGVGDSMRRPTSAPPAG